MQTRNGTSVSGAWPKQVTLTTPDVAISGEAVRLADGEVVPVGGDVSL
jgi:hypothetical protein